jgi:hypothetical protein
VEGIHEGKFGWLLVGDLTWLIMRQIETGRIGSNFFQCQLFSSVAIKINLTRNNKQISQSDIFQRKKKM